MAHALQGKSLEEGGIIDIRLNKYISDTGYCSRRVADELIKQGKVTVEGRQGVLGDLVHDGMEVKVNGQVIKKKGKRIYLALNKPVGVTSTTDKKDPDNIIDFIGHEERIFPIGRLDKDSDGLILLTNDGDIVNKILRAGNQHEKEYIVAVNKPITKTFLTQMAKGVSILDTVTLPCQIKQLGPKTFNITLTQGLNRQIRRMCEALGYQVLSLRRIRIMNIHLGDLKVGNWRYLTKAEMGTIQKMVEDSDKTEAASSDTNTRKSTKRNLPKSGYHKHDTTKKADTNIDDINKSRRKKAHANKGHAVYGDPKMVNGKAVSNKASGYKERSNTRGPSNRSKQRPSK